MPTKTKKNPVETIIAAMSSSLAEYKEETINWTEEATQKHLTEREQQDELRSSQMQHSLDEMFPNRVKGPLYADRTSYDIFDY